MSGRKSTFISSVQKELADERRALKDYIHGDPLLRRFFEVFLFEDLPATDRRAGYIEQAGTLAMIARSREAGLKAPEFRQDGGQFVQTLWRPTPTPTGQATPKSPDKSRSCCERPKHHAHARNCKRRWDWLTANTSAKPGSITC